MKRIFAIVLFGFSMIGVVGLTRWMPSSPIASVLTDDHGPRDGQGPRNGSNRKVGDGRNGFGNRDAADLSVSSSLESLTTLGPQALIVGAFAFSVERARRRRNSDRKAMVDGIAIDENVPI